MAQLNCLIVALLFLSCSSTKPPSSPSEGLDILFRDYNRARDPGAAVLVVKDGKTLQKKSYGLANLEEHRPVSSSTNFRLASITKQFTAMCILMLAEKNELSLDDKILRFFPRLPDTTREIRVRHLLNHTSGLIDYEPLIPDSQTTQVLDSNVLTLLEKADSVYFPAGSKFQYSNSGYVLLSLIIESVSHQSFADFLKQNIFTRLGMANTVARQEGISTVVNRAYGYTQTDSGFVFTDQSVTSATLGDGGIYSSVDDLFQWDQALYTDKLVQRQTLDLAFTPSVKTDTTAFYGFGWFVDEYRGMKCLYHTGTSRGFRNAIIRIPGQSFSVIILTNRNEGDPLDVARRIIDLYFPDEG